MGGEGGAPSGRSRGSPARRSPIQVGVGLVVLCLALTILTVPLLFAAIASAGLVLLLRAARERYAVALVSASLLLLLGLLEGILRALPSDAGPQYYRPQEMLAGHELAQGIASYRPNQRVEAFRVPYGDLAALSGITSIVEPRVVDFYTDSLGFRNRTDYSGQELVLVGDSFAVGSGTTQDEIVSEILTRDHGIPVYNAAYPGEIEDYARRVRFLEQALGTGFRTVVMVFEGNDFRCRREDRLEPDRSASRVYSYIPSFVRKLESYRLLYGLTRRAYHVHLARDRVKETLTVLVERYGDEDLGFYKKYVEKARQPEACGWGEIRALFEQVADRIALLAYVPTKYRVYKSFPGEAGGELPPSPSARFMAALAGELSLPFLDLTPALSSASEELLSEGRYTFWRDDTHWNGHGSRVAAAALAELLRAAPQARQGTSP